MRFAGILERNRITTIIVLIQLAVIAVYLYNTYTLISTIESMDVESYRVQMDQRLRLFTINLGKSFSNLDHTLQSLSKEVEGLPDGSPEMERLLRLGYSENRDFANVVSRVNRTGHIASQYPVNNKALGSYIGGQEHMKRVRSTGKPVMSGVFDAVEGFKGVTVHYPVFAGGEYDGTVSSLVRSDNMLDELSDLTMDESERIFLVDGYGVIASSNADGYIGGDMAAIFKGMPGQDALVDVRPHRRGVPGGWGKSTEVPLSRMGETILSEGDGTFTMPYGDDYLVGAFATLELGGMRWHIIMLDAQSQKSNPAGTQTSGIERDAAITIATIFLISIFSIGFVTRALSDEISDKTRAIEELNRTLETKVKDRTQELKSVNEGLEARIAERTRELSVRLAEAEKMRTAILNVLEDSEENQRKVSEATKKLTESLAFTQSLVNAIPVPIFYKDFDGRYRMCNNAFYRDFYGKSREDVLGKTVDDLMPLGIAGIYRQMDDDIIGGSMLHVSEAPYIAPDGSVRRARVYNSQSIGADGKPEGIIGAILDITELKNSEEGLRKLSLDLAKARDELEDKVRERTRELEKAYEGLKEMDRAKDDFLAITSHELKTPLTSIIGLTELLGEELGEALNADQKEDLGIILDEAKRLKKLIDEILELARLDAGKGVFNMVEVDVNEAAEEAVRELKAFAAQNGVRVAVERSDVPKVAGDRAAVVRLIYNLVNNAIKYTAEKRGEVSVGAAGKGDDVIVHVRDTGIGIPEDARDKMFNRFYQADSSKSRKYGGTGLGLAICRRIVEAHGGTIWFESVVGEGTTFYFTLPVHKGVADES